MLARQPPIGVPDLAAIAVELPVVLGHHSPPKSPSTTFRFLEREFKQGLPIIVSDDYPPARLGRDGQVDDITGPAWSAVRDLLGGVSRSRALQGFTPSETATFVFSMKEPLFTLLREEMKGAQQLADLTWTVTKLLDKLGLYTVEVYTQSRNEMIKRQADELLELSTPVVELWDKILLLPLIGTLDSERTQTVMEYLLNHIVKSRTQIAIIDITGVPTVDTLVAQHLIRTVSAARLMGADCIISGIRPQIAQTIVHLGLQLDVVSKATMADAFALALKRTEQAIGRRAAAKPV